MVRKRNQSLLLICSIHKKIFTNDTMLKLNGKADRIQIRVKKLHEFTVSM